MWRGFEDMRSFGWTNRVPKMMAAEIYGSLGAALKSGSDAVPDMPQSHETVAKSTTATRSTFQALHVLRRSGGTATTVSNESIMQWQQDLASAEGLYVEPASAGALAAVAQLKRSGHIKAKDTVVALLTASGLKDPDATAAVQNPLPAVPRNTEDAFLQLKALTDS